MTSSLSKPSCLMRLGLFIETNTCRAREIERLRDRFRGNSMRKWWLTYNNRQTMMWSSTFYNARDLNMCEGWIWKYATRHVQECDRGRERETKSWHDLSFCHSEDPCKQPQSGGQPEHVTVTCFHKLFLCKCRVENAKKKRKRKKRMLGDPLVPKPWPIHFYLPLLYWETLTNKNCKRTTGVKFIYSYSHHVD